MALKPKEKIKIDNYKAQYNSICGNIASTNKELERYIAERKIAKELLSEVTKELTEKNKELSRLSFGQEEKRKQLETKEIKLIERENKAYKKETNLAEKEKKELEKIKKDIVKQKGLISVTQLRSTIVESQLTQSKKDKKKLEKEIGCLGFDKTVLSKDKRILIEEVITLEERSAEIEKLENKMIESKRLELQTILDKIEDNKVKIESPIQALELRNKEIDRKEKNLQVLILRTKRAWAKLYPNQELKL